MIHQTWTPLPFAEITLRTDYETPALCVVLRVPASCVQMAVITTGQPEDVHALLDSRVQKGFIGGIRSLTHALRCELAAVGDVVEFRRLRDLHRNWSDTMSRWRGLVTEDGDVIAGLEEQAEQMTALGQVPAPRAPIRPSEAVAAMLGYLPTRGDRRTMAAIDALGGEFCRVHELRSPRPGWQRLLWQFTGRPRLVSGLAVDLDPSAPCPHPAPSGTISDSPDS